MRFVALFGHGPTWKRGRTVYEQGAPIEGHLASMRRRFDEGALLLGGPFDDGDGIAVGVSDLAAQRADQPQEA